MDCFSEVEEPSTVLLSLGSSAQHDWEGGACNVRWSNTRSPNYTASRAVPYRGALCFFCCCVRRSSHVHWKLLSIVTSRVITQHNHHTSGTEIKKEAGTRKRAEHRKSIHDRVVDLCGVQFIACKELRVIEIDAARAAQNIQCHMERGNTPPPLATGLCVYRNAFHGSDVKL